MIGKTNSSQGVSSIPSEYVNIRMMTNQASHGDLVGAKFVLSYEKFSQEYVWGGSEMTLQVPAYVVCTIEWGDVEGYKKPEAVTFTTVEDNARTIEVEYQCELLTVNVTADEGVPTGFEVKIAKPQTVGISTKYTKLEYIEGNGSQFINTGYIAKSENYRVKLVFSLTNVISNTVLFGGGASTDIISILIGNPVKFYVGNGSVSAINSISFSQGTTHTIDCHAENGTLSVGFDGNNYTGTYSGSINKDYSLALFGNNVEGTVGMITNGRIYSCQIYDNGTLVRDYIPSLRTDGIAGLYDAVSDTFYPSNGSGNFIAGNKDEELIATQTSVTGSYKIPFNESYSVQANNVDGYIAPSSVTRIANSKSYTVTQQYTLISEIDLSLQDIYGNPIKRSTANCYVVREAGQYKFPLVFGNAIKNGKVNTAAFTNNGGANSHDFVYGTPYTSYESDVITQPYINPYFALSSSDVQIETSDVDGAITDLGLEDGDECKFVTFKVANVPTTGGNVIITLNTAYGDYWSWHIWLWPHDLSPVEITNATGVKYKIMPVNLASKYDSDGVHIKNWFYQWGRPNPMLCSDAWNSTTDHSPGSITKTSKADTLKIGIMNPSKFYYNSASPHNWFGTKSYYNLWDAACTGTGNSDNDTVKTVYDPCPVGWKVPNGNVFTGFGSFGSIEEFDYGIKFCRYSGDKIGVFFPYSSGRDYSTGNINSVIYGYAWLSSAYSQERASVLYFYDYIVNPQDSRFRASGLSIRPVQDDNIQLDVIMISFMIYHRDGRTTSHQAESGMTWFEWVHSDYNTAGAAIDSSNWYVRVDSLTVKEPNELAAVRGSDNIVGGETYIL